jgi:hypothetical protein
MKVLYPIFLLIFFSCEVNKNSSQNISKYLISYYESKSKIKADSVHYFIESATEKDLLKDQKALYSVERILWEFSDYSTDLKSKKKDEYQWKVDSCETLELKMDSVKTKYYKTDAYFFIKGRIDTIGGFYMDKSYKIIPSLKVFDVPEQTKKMLSDVNDVYF